MARERSQIWLSAPLIIILVFSSSAITSLAISTTALQIRSFGTIGYPTISKLHVDGRWIKNESNSTVILKGVNKEWHQDPTGWWSPPNDWADGFGVWNPGNVKAHLDAMRSWGINVIRLYSRIEHWIDDTPDPSGVTTYGGYRQHLKDVIQLAGERGIYVVYAPWCVGGYADPGDVTTKPQPYPPYTTAEERVIVPSEQAFIDYWADVGTELKGFPNVIFELWNEPAGDENQWVSVAQRSIDAIRATGADQLIVVQYGYSIWTDPDYGWSFEWVDRHGMFNDPSGNVVYSTHIYRYHQQLGTWMPYAYADVRHSLELCLLRYLDRFPIWIGEVGSYGWWSGDELYEELVAFKNVLKVLNEWQLGYAIWEWFVQGPRAWGLYLQPDFAHGTTGEVVGSACKDSWPTEYRLTVESEPINTNIDFSDGTTAYTPTTKTFTEGLITVSVPVKSSVNGEEYNFAFWSTGSASNSLTFDLLWHRSVKAYYEKPNPLGVFGKTTKGATWHGIGGWKHAGRYKLPVEGIVKNITVYFLPYASSFNAKAAIYSDLNGKPDKLLVQSGSIYISAEGWHTFDIPGTMLELGYYWIAVMTDTSSWNNAMFKDPGAANHLVAQQLGGAVDYPTQFSDPWGTAPTGFYAESLSIYACYDPA